VNYLGNIISSVNPVRSVADIKAAFEKDSRKAFGEKRL
jgi:hypothetical protein